MPTYSPRPADPRAGPVKLVLKPQDLSRRDPALVLRGRVIDDRGQPVAGAVVEPFGFQKGNGTQFGGLQGFDPLAVTDARGAFGLGVPEKGAAVLLGVTARGLAPRKFRALAAGPTVHELNLEPGANVLGEVRKDGKALAGVTLGLAQRSRRAETFLGDSQISTDEQGRFLFRNVAAHESYYLYGLIDSLRPQGAIPVRDLQTGASGTAADVGVLAVQAGHRLTGRVVLADGKPVPPGTQVVLAREQAWDHTVAVAAADGRFTFTGLPSERYTLSARVPGYHISPKNASVDPLNGFRLLGVIETDIDGLRLLLEPGRQPLPDSSRFNQANLAEYQRRQQSPLQGAPAETQGRK